MLGLAPIATSREKTSLREETAQTMNTEETDFGMRPGEYKKTGGFTKMANACPTSLKRDGKNRETNLPNYSLKNRGVLRGDTLDKEGLRRGSDR